MVKWRRSSQAKAQFADEALGSDKRVRLTHDGIPAEVPEARPESLLSPLVPAKAINALGCGRRPDWVNPDLGLDDL